jgi:HAD superfamily hydrolase (TIGR01509 family)
VDGTLAETEEIHRDTFNAAFAAAGFARDFPDHRAAWVWDRDLYRRLLGVTGGKERIAAYMAGDLGLDPAPHAARIAEVHADKTRRYGEAVAAGALRLRPGIADILRRAREAGLNLAVATTTSPANVEALIQATLGRPAREVFDVVAAGDEAPRKKPAPDVYLLALERLGLPADAALALEDSRNGLLAAKAAGLRCIVCPNFYTAGEAFGEADAVVQAFNWASVRRAGS